MKQHFSRPRPSAILFVVGLCSLPWACSSGTDGGSGGSATGGSTATGGTTASSSGGATTGGTTTTGGSAGGGTTGGSGGTGGGGGGTTGTRTGAGGAVTTGGGAGAVVATGGSSGGGATTRDASPDRGLGAEAGPMDARTTDGAVADTGAGGATGGTKTGGAGGSGGTTTGGSGGGPSTGGTTGGGGSTAAGGSTGTSTLCPPGITQTITVAKDGSGQFNTVQAAVNSIASGSSAHVRIDIKAGTYTEKLTIASRTNLCLVGAGATSTVLTYGDSSASVGSTSGSASVLISANDFSAANLTIANSYGTGSQAVALRTTGQRQQFLGCRFIAHQDTLYTHNGSQYFRNCYVEGTVDYVFGGATAVLQNCEIRNVEGGSATTAPNTDASTAYGIVFLGGKFTAESGVKAGSVALARPWGAAGFAAFLNAELGAHISAAGFTSMSGNAPENARFHEYGSTGPGASTSRSSYQLTAAQAASYTLATIFGSWTPSYSQ